MENLNPAEAFEILTTTRDPFELRKALDYLKFASARELQEFLLLCIATRHTNFDEGVTEKWVEFARVTLEIRISEDAAKSSDALLAHTKKLTHQTDDMILESKRLRNLTWALLILTFVLAILTAALYWIDWHKDKTGRGEREGGAAQWEIQLAGRKPFSQTTGGDAHLRRVGRSTDGL